MPWKSSQQRKWGHTPQGEAALGGPDKVAEWDRATKGVTLPTKAPGSRPVSANKRVVMRRYGPTKTRSDVAAPARMN